MPANGDSPGAPENPPGRIPDGIGSRAIVAYTGWGTAKRPIDDARAVAAIAHDSGLRPETLLRFVQAAIDSSERMDASGIDPASRSAGDEYRSRLRRARGDLSEDAVYALASRWFYRRVWLGIEPSPPTRYFALFSPLGAERLPRALFRRRWQGDTAIDEVLRDVERWDPDEKGRVEKAITRYIDSDLEEITAAEAADFVGMVERRAYRPFTRTLPDIPTFATFLEYKGRRLRYRSGGGTWVRVDIDGEPSRERFPDALEFSSDPGEPWVKLPRGAFDAKYVRDVRGTWHGVRVAVESVIQHGLSRGLVRIRYDGDRPDEAIAAGLHGNQNDGWSAEVDAADLEDIEVTLTLFPLLR